MPRASRVSNEVLAILEDSLRDDLVITPPLKEFLSRDEDILLSRPMVKQVIKSVTVPGRDRSGSFSASSVGRCKRRQEFAFLGMPVTGSIDTRLRQIFWNGTWTHLRWQATLLTAGLLDQTETTIRRPSLRIQGAIDGIGTATRGRYVGREFGFELKSRNQWAYRNQGIRESPDQLTLSQVDAYFFLSGFDLFVIVNENKDTQDWTEWVIRRDEDRVRRVEDTIIRMNEAIDSKRLHPMLDECKKRKGEFKDCPYGGDGGICINSGKWPL